MLKSLRSITFILLLPMLQACSSSDNSTFFEKHEIAFKAQTNYKMHYVKRDNLKIHVREFGFKSDKPTIVLMHGFPDSMHLYDRLVPELMKDEHIITFDFIGWGDSDKPKQYNYDFDRLISDLDTVVKHFNLPKIILIGHDASGPTAINWSFDNQEKVAGLVILNAFYSPMPTLVPPEEIKIFSTPGIKRWFSVQATTLSDSLYIKRYNAQIAKFISTKKLVEPTLKVLGHQFLNIRPAFYGLNRKLLEEVANNGNKTKRLASFKPPVRIIFGEDDPYLNTGVAKELHKLYGDSELTLIKNAGHFVQVDKPAEVAKLIKNLRQ